jgi:hypothetical protein
MAQPTLLDIAKLNGNEVSIGLIEENLTFAPEIQSLPVKTVKGTSYRTVGRDTYPSVGFRNANEGLTYGKSTFLNRLHECKLFGGNLRVDVAVAAADEQGPDHLKGIEASGIMRAAMIELGQQFYYGVSNDAKGFPGLQAFHSAFSTELTARSIDNLTIDAGGTTASTGSSVYGVKFGNDGIQLIVGQGGMFGLGEWFTQMVGDGTTDYLAWVNTMSAWLGLQAANPYCVGRIKDLTADSGKGLTDSLGQDLLALYPVGFAPDVWFMNRRSRAQLQKSRNVVLTSGVPQNQKAVSGSREVVAPIPTEMCGIPIICTDSITNTEALS